MSGRYIVMTAGCPMPSSCWGKYGRVAVVERAPGMAPSQIHPRHKAVVRIVATWEKLNIGTTARCAFSRALMAAEALADKLNAETPAEWIEQDTSIDAEQRLNGCRSEEEP